MPTLTYQIAGASSPVSFEICKQITTIGTGRENDICLPDPLLAEDHAHLQFDGKSFTVSVIHKKNDLQVNGRARRQSTLKHNDEMRMGSTHFRFRMFSDEPAATEAPPIDQVEAYKRIYEFSRQLLQDHSMPVLLEKLLDQVIEVTRADRGFIIMIEGNEPKVAIGRNIKGESLADATTLYSDSIVSQVVKEQKALIVSDALRDENFKSSASVVNLQLSSVMCAPLMERGKFLGVLYVGNSHVASLFDGKAMEILTVFAAQASLLIRNALLVNELVLDNQRLVEQLEDLKKSEIIGTCEALTKVLKLVRKVAPTDVSVLITGETGTGKELIAKELHRKSNRSEGPFVTINCGAIPENLLESELFGHVKGAFTGAVADKLGKFKAADGGTLFLDEMGELPLSLQVKLLRALEEKTITPVGDIKPQEVDIRVIAATNKNLKEESEKGTFREDLYYRINAITFELPPLRERGDDIMLLARYFLHKYAQEHNRPIKGFTAQAAILLRKNKWQGNIRELNNQIKGAVIVADGTHIGPEDLRIKESDLEPILPLAEAKERFQAQYIREALARNNGNRSKTAEDLQVNSRTIFRHLEKEQEREEA